MLMLSNRNVLLKIICSLRGQTCDFVSYKEAVSATDQKQISREIRSIDSSSIVIRRVSLGGGGSFRQ